MKKLLTLTLSLFLSLTIMANPFSYMEAPILLPADFNSMQGVCDDPSFTAGDIIMTGLPSATCTDRLEEVTLSFSSDVTKGLDGTKDSEGYFWMLRTTVGPVALPTAGPYTLDLHQATRVLEFYGYFLAPGMQHIYGIAMKGLPDNERDLTKADCYARTTSTLDLMIYPAGNDACFLTDTEDESVLSINNVYPVPATEMVNLQFNAAIASNALLTVYDVSGKSVYNDQFQTRIGLNDEQLQVGEFHQGIYFARLVVDDYVTTFKIYK